MARDGGDPWVTQMSFQKAEIKPTARGRGLGSSYSTQTVYSFFSKLVLYSLLSSPSVTGCDGSM